MFFSSSFSPSRLPILLLTFSHYSLHLLLLPVLLRCTWYTKPPHTLISNVIPSFVLEDFLQMGCMRTPPCMSILAKHFSVSVQVSRELTWGPASHGNSWSPVFSSTEKCLFWVWLEGFFCFVLFFLEVFWRVSYHAYFSCFYQVMVDPWVIPGFAYCLLCWESLVSRKSLKLWVLNFSYVQWGLVELPSWS